MHESEEHFRQFAENVTDVFWIVDIVTERALYISPAYEKFWGCGKETIDENLAVRLKTVHPEDRARVRAAFRRIKKTGSYHEEYRIIRPDGKVGWIRDRGFPVPDEGGKFTRVVFISEDITDHKEVETDQEQILVREQHAREVAEAVNRAKDEFIAVISHELRAPLNAILGWVHILKNRSVNENAFIHAVEVIERSARSQQQMIEDLIDTVRITKGKMRLEMKQVDLAQVIESSTEALHPAAAARGIKMRLTLKGKDNVITGDPDRLQQVIWNLLSNAVKFTPDDGEVEVQLERADPYLRITVKDNGKGISQDLLPHIFNRFRQDDSFGKRRQGGLGLGLALVRHLVELHGGTAEAESAGEGQGSTFKVNLPLRALRSQKAGREYPVSHENAPTIQANSLSGIQILVVDDEADARNLLATLLSQYGATVSTASSAAEALILLKESQTQSLPDLLISDIGMPGEDGYSLIQRIRRLAPQEGGLIPAIALTAYGRASDRIKALSAGFQTHLPKPVEPAELVITIVNLTGSTGKGMGT